MSNIARGDLVVCTVPPNTGRRLRVIKRDPVFLDEVWRVEALDPIIGFPDDGRTLGKSLERGSVVSASAAVLEAT